MEVHHYKVAIIGGGISGLYAAMKLKQDNKFKDEEILILEKSDRWGGRLDTDIVKVGGEGAHKPMIKEEEGAMRFTFQNMPTLTALIKHLGLKTDEHIQPFLMAPHGKLNNNVQYFRGKHFTQWYAKQNPNLWYQMFSLEENERFKSADDIVRDIYRRLLDHNKSKVVSRFPKEEADVILAQTDNKLLQKYQDPEYWSFFRNTFSWPVGLQEITLNQFSMQALLAEMKYSHASCMMLVETQGFLSLSLSAGNVGCILQDLVTFELIGSNLLQFKQGWSYLVNEVKKNIKGQGVHLKKRHEVTKLEEVNKDGKQIFSLHAKTTYNSGNEETKTQSEENSKNYTAEHVILALPGLAVERLCPRMLEDEVGGEGEKFKSKMERFCRSVVGIHCTKINLYFDRDWWNEGLDKKLYGPNVTSLPCGFVYPFYGRCHCDSNNCDGNCDCCNAANITDSVTPCVAALTIYCDVNNAQFWSSLQLLGHKFESRLQHKDQHKNLAPASEAVVTEALRQLAKIFNMEEVPAPILTSFRSWDGKARSDNGRKLHEQFGFAVHMWGLGVDDRKVRREVTQPIANGKLYMCNEAWSDYQGWVEGSLRSTDEVVKIMTGKESDQNKRKRTREHETAESG